MKRLNWKSTIGLLFSIVFIVFLFNNTIIVFADEPPFNESATVGLDDNDDLSLSTIIENLISGLNLDELKKLFDEYGSVFLSGNTLDDIINESLNGIENFQFSSIFSVIFNLFMNNIKDYFAIVLTIISIAFLGAFTSAVGPTNNKICDVVFLVCYGLICIILFNECINCFNQVKGILANICKQTEGVFPLLLTLVLICGGKSSATAFKPICVFLNNGILQIILKVLFPILIIACVLIIIVNLNEKFRVKGLFNLVLDSFKWIIGITIVVFSFFITIQGFGSSIRDGVSLRALKYTIGNSVPIIGSFAKDGVDLVIASGILIKNTIGSVAIVLIFSALITPFLSILAFSLTLKLLNAIIQPFTDIRLCNLVNAFSKVITHLCVLVIMVFIVYFITLFLIICSQNQIMVA